MALNQGTKNCVNCGLSISVSSCYCPVCLNLQPLQTSNKPNSDQHRHVPLKRILAATGILTVLLIATFIAVGLQPVGYTVTIPQNVSVNAIDPETTHLKLVNVEMVTGNIDPVTGKNTIYSTSYSHNLLTYVGKNIVKSNLATTSNQTTLLDLMIFNDSAYTPNINDQKCDPATQPKVENSYGLAPATGTYVSTGIGTWNVTLQFTLNTIPGSPQVIYGSCLTSSLTVNAVNLGAVATFANTATLTATGDYCKVTWMLSVS